MSRSIMCFSWNTDSIPLCEGYLNNKTERRIDKARGTFSKTTACYNPLFFDSIEYSIVLDNIDIVIFLTENDLDSGTWFHSDFLPTKMKNIGGRLNYKLIARDKYTTDSTIRMSIFIKSNDKITKVIELNKILLYNDNTLDCKINHSLNGNIDYVEKTKALALYLQTDVGKIAIVGLQVDEGTKSQDSMRPCIENIERKFFDGKKLDHVFIMGDFVNDIPKNYVYSLPEIETLNKNFTTSTRKLSYVKDPLYNESDGKPQFPTYSSGYGGLDDNIKNYINKPELLLPLYKDSTMGYHDRIFHRSFNTPQLLCTTYKPIYGFPILSTKQNNHLGILGIYKISK